MKSKDPFDSLPNSILPPPLEPPSLHTRQISKRHHRAYRQDFSYEIAKMNELLAAPRGSTMVLTYPTYGRAVNGRQKFYYARTSHRIFFTEELPDLAEAAKYDSIYISLHRPSTLNLTIAYEPIEELIPPKKL